MSWGNRHKFRRRVVGSSTLRDPVRYHKIVSSKVQKKIRPILMDFGVTKKIVKLFEKFCPNILTALKF